MTHQRPPAHAAHGAPQREYERAAPALMLIVLLLVGFLSGAAAASSPTTGNSPALLTKELIHSAGHVAISFYTAAQQANTLRFLSEFRYTIPSLSNTWVGHNFCDWNGVRCSSAGVEVRLDPRRLVGRLPEVPTVVDAAQVMMTSFAVSNEGDGIEDGLPESWMYLDQLTSLEIRLDFNLHALKSRKPQDMVFSMSTRATKASVTKPKGCVLPRNAVNVSLAYNRITGPLPPNFPLCNPRMKYLYLQNNTGLSGSIPNEWGNWTSLRVINLQLTKVCGCPPKEWAIFDPPVQIEAEDKVTDPELCKVSCSGSGDDCYAPVPYYSTAQQVHTRTFLDAFKDSIPMLRELWVCPNFCAWPYVQCTRAGLALEMAGAPIVGSLPPLPLDVDVREVVVNKVDMSEIQDIAGQLPPSWGSLVSMQHMAVPGTLIFGSLPPEWSRMTNLKYLDAGGAMITGELPSSWSDLKNLEVLRVNEAMLTGTLPHSWGGMTSLKELNLGWNTIDADLPASWSDLRGLQSVQLHHNYLSGTLPPSWSVLLQMHTFRVDKNQLIGMIPESYSNWTLLTHARLENNHLCGCLPSKWVEHNGLSMKVTADPPVMAPDCATENACKETTSPPLSSSSAPSSSSSSSTPSSSSSSSSSNGGGTTTSTPVPTGDPVEPSSSSSSSASSIDNSFYYRLSLYCPNAEVVGEEVIEAHKEEICCRSWTGSDYNTSCGESIVGFSNAIVTCSGALGSRGYFSCCSRVAADGTGEFLGTRCRENSAAAPAGLWMAGTKGIGVLWVLTTVIGMTLL
ncbi:hypothetical protein CUR178_00811 [Leishmania enriettii]|uniref:Proteophosphoglycan ppg3 n=1 Tax=Leishmania enriettii TaxID=5663 RepID=A0A836GYM0_LEIEN|nr:hypothetical protein CUR178_00811 [Leishmania enriettii]